jgi:hypothetical protein
MELTYWRGSAIGKENPQELTYYTFYDVSVFHLSSLPNFSDQSYNSRRNEVITRQKEFLKSLWNFGNSQMILADISHGYSLRFIYSPSQTNEIGTTNIYLVARIATNDSSEIVSAKRQQTDYITSLLASQTYKFELIETEEKLHQPNWITDIDNLSCYGIIKTEEVFQWIESDGKFFYSPGKFHHNSSNDMVGFLQQLQNLGNSGAEVCIDLVIIPTSVESYEKKVLSNYINALDQASRGIAEEGIEPDRNAQKAKKIYEYIQEKYNPGSVFLYDFRIFSTSKDTCFNVASQLSACCSSNLINPKIIGVKNLKYVVKNFLGVNICDQISTPGVWDESTSRPDGFKGGPVTLKRLHRLASLDEVSTFFRLPIPTGQLNLGLRYENEVVELPENLSITDIIQKFDKYVTEDTYVVGVDEMCQPYTSDFTKIPHRIVAGTTGAGKTNFLLGVIYQFLYASAKIKAKRNIYIADFKEGIDFYKIKNYEGVNLVTNAEDLAALTLRLVEEHQRRIKAQIENDVESLRELRKKCNTNDHRILLIIDEAGSISNADRKLRDQIDKNLYEIASKSRRSEIHLFYCSQRPTRDILSPQISENIDERVIFRLVSPGASQLLLDDDIAASLPVVPKGIAVYKGAQSELKKLKTPYVPKEVFHNPLY